MLQLIFEYLGNLGESPLIQLVVNVGISYIQDKLNDKFSDFIHGKLSENLILGLILTSNFIRFYTNPSLNLLIKEYFLY